MICAVVGRSCALRAWRSPMMNDTTPAAASVPVTTHSAVVALAYVCPDEQSFLYLSTSAPEPRLDGGEQPGLAKNACSCGDGFAGRSGTRSLCAVSCKPEYVRHV